jgi:DNA-binding PucR family transcriptional regulator
VLVALLGSSPVAEVSRRAAALAGQTARVHVYGKVVVVVLQPDEDPARLVEQIRVSFPSAVGGAAVVPDGASDWAATFRLAAGLARAASALGRPLGSADEPAVIADLLLQEAQAAVSDLVQCLPHQPLRRVAEYDARTSSQLLQTVAAWCNAGLDVAVAADAMHLHQNTFRYRLKRACEISGLDLTQPRQLLALQVLLAGRAAGI